MSVQWGSFAFRIVRVVPVTASVAVHVAVAATLLVAATGHAGSIGVARSAGEVAEIDLAKEDLVLESVPLSASSPRPTRTDEVTSSTPLAHTHPFPVTADHDAKPHDPSQPHAQSANTAPDAPALAAVVASEPTLPSFAISVPADLRAASDSHASVSSNGSNGTSETLTNAVNAHGAGGRADAVYRDGDVSNRARLVAGVTAAYPPDARAGELEADVAVEIVVDTAGAVTDARVVRKAGSGFDESALAAVRRYRFAPATREGRPVRVRMRWSVQFRLR